MAYTHHTDDYAPSTAPLLGSGTLGVVRSALAKAWRYAQHHPMQTLHGLYTVAVATLLALAATTAVKVAFETLRTEQALLVVNVVLEYSANKVQTETALGLLRRIEGVDSLTVFTPEQTQRHFAERFGNDMDKLLAESPFVTAAALHLEPEFRTASGLSSVAAQAQAVKSVSDVQYHEPFAHAVDVRAAQTTLCSWLGGALVSLAIISLLSAGLRSNHHRTFHEQFAEHTRLKQHALSEFLPQPSYPLMIALTGISVGAIAGVCLRLGLAAQLPWLMYVTPLLFVGVLGALVVVSIIAVLLQATVLVDESTTAAPTTQQKT